MGTKLNILEIEIRVGSLSSSGFRPGVHQDDFDFIERLLSNSKTPVISDEVDYIYPHGDERGRVTWDAEETRVLRACQKVGKKNFDIGSNLVYDFRVSSATEQEISYDSQAVEPGYQTRRQKRRLTYKDKYWKIELTTVTTHQQGQPETTQYEVEFELSPSSIPNHSDKTHMRSVLSQFLGEPRNLISTLEVPNERTFPEIVLEKVTNPDELGDLRDALMNVFPAEEENLGQAFPGSMPVNFSRRHFPMVQSSDYFVSEKTDGLRYMFMVTNEAPYFVDRKFDFYLIQGYDLLIELYGLNGTTLLDGELIRNLSSKKPVFMIFDALQLNGGESACSQKLVERFKLINEAVVAFRTATESKPSILGTLPFSIIGKRFLPQNQINALFKEIRLTHVGHEYRDAKRHHLTDGLIFTPNTPYLSFTSHHILKWKYLEKLTVDFKYKIRNQKRYLSCGGMGDTEVECREILFSESDNKRLFKDVARSRDHNNIIVECNFDTVSGIWKYHGVRADKHKPNFIQTVFDTMENIAENITAEEIRYRVSVPTKYDDYDAKMRAARDALLHKLMPGHQASTSHNSSTHSSSRPNSNPHANPQPRNPPPKPASTPKPPHSNANPHATSHSSPSQHAPRNSNNKPLNVNQPISTYEFGDEDEYEDTEERQLPKQAAPPSRPPSNNKSNGHSYQPPPAAKPSSFDDDDIASGGEDWQKPEDEYEYGDDRQNGGDEDDE